MQTEHSVLVYLKLDVEGAVVVQLPPRLSPLSLSCGEQATAVFSNLALHTRSTSYTYQPCSGLRGSLGCVSTAT
jgi:hypothetical protein